MSVGADAGDRAPRTGPGSDARAELRPRDRILDAAADLFARDGVRAVGVDAIIATAAVAKASFYRHFRSKDDLIVAWLQADRTRWLDRVRFEAAQRASTPEGQLLAFFDVIVEQVSAPGSTGCAYLNTGTELRTGSAAVHAVVVSYLDEVEAHFLSLAGQIGVASPEVVAFELRVLCAGGMILSSVLGDPSNARAARAAAERLLGS